MSSRHRRERTNRSSRQSPALGPLAAARADHPAGEFFQILFTIALSLVVLRPEPALAGAEPSICWTSDASASCGCPATEGAISDEASSFRLFLDPGPARYSGTACAFATGVPDGDEVCAIAIGLESTHADVTLDGFASSIVGAPDLVANLIGSQNLVINHLMPSGLSSCLELGTVSVTHATGDNGLTPTVRITETTSEWTNAALGTEVFSAIALPEPSFPLLLVMGLALLQVLARQQQTFRRSACLKHGARIPMALIGLGIAWTPGGADAFEYFDLNAFLARAGPGAVRLDLSGFPLDDAGYNVFETNPEERRGIKISAPGVPSVVSFPELAGKTGTFLVFDSGLEAHGIVASPGGTIVQDDGVFLDFVRPVRGVGLRIIDATSPDGARLTADDKVIFRDAHGQILAVYSLDQVKRGRSAFVGYVARPGTLPVATVEFVETSDPSQPDHVWIDDIVVLQNPDPYADDWRDYAPGTAVAPVNLPSLEDPALALDAPDGRFFELSANGSIVMWFKDNALVTSLDASPDLRIYAQTNANSKVGVEISQDGDLWVILGTLAAGTFTDFDIDSAFNIVPNEPYAFVRLSGTGAATDPPSFIDAVEALSSAPIEDNDFDGAADPFDNCPGIPNPSQADGDGDGVGNRCDVCRQVVDPLQSDVNGDGIGDACEGPTLELVLDPPPGTSGLKLTGGDLYLDCGGAEIQSLNFAVGVPPGAGSFVFGAASTDSSATAGCEAPSEENVFSPFTAASGCVTAADLGTTVNPLVSGAVYGDPGTGDPEAFYLFLSAGNDPIDRLCAPGQEGVYLGRLNFVADLAAPSSRRVRLGQWGSLLNWFDSARLSDPDLLLSTRVTQGNGIARTPTPILGAGLVSGSEPAVGLITSGATASSAADVVLELREADLSADGLEQSWDLCITDESVLRMTRVTVGIEGPVGASGTADMVLVGCEDPGPVGGWMDCQKDAVEVGSTVDEAGSFAFGPEAAGSPSLFGSLQDSTLYVSLSGSYSDSFSTGLLNASTTSSTCLATITIADPGHVPSLTLVGIEDLTSPVAPLLDEFAAESEPDAVVIRNTSYDADGDAILEGDNCVLVANVDQLNSGGFQSSLSDVDLDGDACECGDGNATGAVWQSGVEGTADVASIRSYLASLSSDIATRLKCSAVDTTTCNMADVVAWYTGLNLGGAVGDGTCEAVSGAEPE